MALLLWRGCPAAHDFAGGLIAICVPLMVFCTAFCGPNRPAQMPRDAASQASRDAAGTQSSGLPGRVPWGGAARCWDGPRQLRPTSFAALSAIIACTRSARARLDLTSVSPNHAIKLLTVRVGTSQEPACYTS